MSKWRDPKLKGWTPKQKVGVGAGFWDDPFGEVLNAFLTPVGADQTWTQSMPNFGQQPLEAIGHAAIGAFTLPQEVVKYGTGAVIGGMQALGEAVGANPAGQPIDVRSRVPQTNLQPLKRAVELGAGPAGPALAANLIPDRLDQMFTALDTPNRPKTLPSTQGGNILDPTTARSRFSAVAPPTLELATDLLAGFKGPQIAGAALGRVGAPLRSAVGFDRFAPVIPLGRQAGKLAGVDDLPTVVKDWMQTQAGTRARAALTIGPPLIGAAGMGATTQATDQEPVGSAVWFAHVGQRAVIGSILGLGVTALGVGALRIATAGAIDNTVRVPASAGPLARAYLQGRNDAATVAGRGSLNPANYPGSWLGYVANGIKDVITDGLAGLKGAERTAVTRIESGKAFLDAQTELPIAQAALTEHSTQTMPQFLQARNAADAAYAAKIQAGETAAAARAAAQKASKDATAAVNRKTVTSRQAYTQLISQPTDPLSVSKMLSGAEKAVDAAGRETYTLRLGPNMEAELIGTADQAGGAAWRPKFGPAAMQAQTFTPQELLQNAQREAVVHLQSGADWLDRPADLLAHVQRGAAAQDAKAALEAANLKHEAALAEAAGLKPDVEIARAQWLEADRIHKVLERRAAALQEAVDRGHGSQPVPHSDLFGRLSQSLNGLDGAKADMREWYRRNLYNRVRTETVRTRLGPVKRAYGIGGKADFKTYNDWRSAFGMKLRALDGHPSVARAAQGTEPAVFIRTIEDAQAQYKEVMQTLKIDSATESRYINTVRKETEHSNQYIVRLHKEGFITEQDMNKILEQPFYIRANVLSDIVQNWNESAALKAQKLFAGSKGIEQQHSADQVFSATTQDLTDRNAHIIQLIQQNRVMRAAVRTAAADPMGLGTIVQKFTSESDAALHAFGTRADELYGEWLRTKRGLTMLERQTTGSANGVGPLNSAVNKNQRLFDKAIADYRRDPNNTGYRNRMLKWNAELAKSREALGRADQRLTALREQEPLLKIQRDQMLEQIKNRKSAAPQEAWRRSIQVKRDRAAELRGNAADLTQEATAARTPKRQKELIEQARKKEEAAVKQDALAEDLEKSGLPEPLASDALPAGMRGVPVYENGAAEIYTVPDWFHSYLTGANTPQVDVFTRFMSSVLGKFWRAAVTTYSTSFAIRNAPRDFQTALVNYAGAGNVPEFLGHYAKAWQDVIGTTAGRGLEDLFSALARSDGMGLGGGEKFGSWADKLNKLVTLKSDTERSQRAGIALGTFVESQGGGVTIGTPLDFLRKFSLLFEMPARVAVFKGEKALGATDAAAAYAGRTILTDFSKAGHAGRVLNMWTPLINARWQGQLQSWDSFKQNPQSFLTRSATSIAMPFVTSYVWNRTQFGDLLDQIPSDVLSRNGVVIYSKWFNDKTQREEPLYFKIPLSEVGQGISVPLRYMLDQTYHQETQGGQALDPQHRSVWSPAGALRQVISGLLPMNPQPSELDPMGLIMASITMNPGMAAYTGVTTNWDRFRGRPVVDEEEAALWDQYRWAPPDTSVFAQVATELMSDLGMKRGHLAPMQVDFTLRQFGGSLMQQPAAGAIDSVFREVWKATHGSQPLPSEHTLSPADLANAPSSFAKYVNANKLPDNRPGIVKNLGFIFGAGGSAQAITDRVKQDDPRRYDAWIATRKYQDETVEYDQTVYRPKLKEIYAHTDWSFAKINDEVTTLGKQRLAVRERILSENVGAIVDPTKRREFLAGVPGVPVDPEGNAGLMSLPAGVDIDALTQRFMSPPGVPSAVFGSLSTQQQQDYRSRELETIARDLSKQYGQPVSPDTVGRAITAKQRGLTIPALPMPEVYVEDWLARWRNPPGYEVGDPPEKMRKERDLELTKIVNEYKVVQEMQSAGVLDPTKDPQAQAEQAVLETINTRFLPPGEVITLDVSRDRAYSLSSWVRDTTEFPPFVDSDGKPFGNPQEWQNWTQQLNMADQSGRDKKYWPAELRLLDRYRSYGESLKVDELYNNPNYLDYSRWFGVGRTMTQDQWSMFQSGQIPKYTKNGQPDGEPIDPGIALQLDYLAAKYRALPDGAEKRRLQPKVKRIRNMAVPNWKLALETYELLPESQRSLQDDLLRLDSERADAQQQNQLAYQNVVALG